MAKGNSGMRGNRPAGGLGSRVNVNVPVRYGATARQSSPGGVSQIGSSLGNHSSEQSNKLRGAVVPMDGGKPPISVKLGNEIAGNVGKGGPGTGRQLLGQGGTQGCYGPVAGKPAPKGADILRQFGPDSAKR